MLPDGLEVINLSPENIADYGVCGYKDARKHLELRRKIDWYREYYPRGLRIKALVSEKDGYQGMIEYIPGQYAHRPVSADRYMFIHCIFTGLRSVYKGKGYGSVLIKECIKDAENGKMDGVAVVTRKGSFMADNRIFTKNGFIHADEAMPDFELLVLKFDNKSKDPVFLIKDIDMDKYGRGLTVIRSAQCPYSVKNVDAILETAERMNIKVKLVEIKNHEDARNVPCAFGTFCIIHDGQVISHHPISNTRFENIMKARGKKNVS